MASETTAIERWIAATLEADEDIRDYCVGGVHGHIAAQGARRPYLVFEPEPGRDSQENALDRSRAVLYRSYRVFVVADSCGFEPMETAAGRIFSLLHRQGVEDVDPRFLCEEIGDIREHKPQEFGGAIIQIYQRGGLYRFIVTPES